MRKRKICTYRFRLLFNTKSSPLTIQTTHLTFYINRFGFGQFMSGLFRSLGFMKMHFRQAIEPSFLHYFTCNSPLAFPKPTLPNRLFLRLRYFILKLFQFILNRRNRLLIILLSIKSFLDFNLINLILFPIFKGNHSIFFLLLSCFLTKINLFFRWLMPDIQLDRHLIDFSQEISLIDITMSIMPFFIELKIDRRVLFLTIIQYTPCPFNSNQSINLIRG